MTIRRLPILLLLPLLLLSAGFSFKKAAPPPAAPAPPPPPPPEKARGNYLRTEIREVIPSRRLTCTLVMDGEYRQPAIAIAYQDIQTITDVKLYETILRKFTPAAQPGGEPSVSVEVIPGELWPGETTRRQIASPRLPLTDTEIRFNGKPARTDAKGIARHPDGTAIDLLPHLDFLEKRTADFQILAAGFPECVYRVYRTMPQRQAHDEKRLDEPEDQDVLVVAGLDFRQARSKPEQERLQCRVTLPGNLNLVTAGRAFPVTVTVSNHGQLDTSCLLARSFSRLPALNGILFYFGKIPPGKTASFTRFVTLPKNLPGNLAFAEIRFTDSWSPLPHALPLKLTVIH